MFIRQDSSSKSWAIFDPLEIHGVRQRYWKFPCKCQYHYSKRKEKKLFLSTHWWLALLFHLTISFNLIAFLLYGTARAHDFWVKIKEQHSPLPSSLDHSFSQIHCLFLFKFQTPSNQNERRRSGPFQHENPSPLSCLKRENKKASNKGFYMHCLSVFTPPVHILFTGHLTILA